MIQKARHTFRVFGKLACAFATGRMRRTINHEIALIQENSETSSRELAAHLGITERAVKKQIAILKTIGKLRRIGPDKGGHWEVANL
jgi:predicted HTH transcriptional regulator